MNSLQTVRYVGGFAMAGSITPEQYKSAKPDPVSKFSSGMYDSNLVLLLSLKLSHAYSVNYSVVVNSLESK